MKMRKFILFVYIYKNKIMPESMTLIEQANIFNKTNHQNLFFNRILSKQNVDVYSSQYLVSNSTTKQTKHHHLENFILPPIDKDDHRSRKNIRRPVYRTSLYHPNSRNSNLNDLSSLTARGKKPELTIRDDDTIRNLQNHHAPPPSPSDDHLQRLVADFNRNRYYTSRSPTETDGYIPYRLPSLSQTSIRSHAELNIRSKDIKSTFSNYLQKFY
jgi:hypothetical protein